MWGLYNTIRFWLNIYLQYKINILPSGSKGVKQHWVCWANKSSDIIYWANGSLNANIWVKEYKSKDNPHMEVHSFNVHGSVNMSTPTNDHYTIKNYYR